MSDLHLTLHCGLVENPGDLLLADRGFNIQEAVGVYCAEVKVPPFTKGKPQLSRMEVDTARELAHVRIHMERVHWYVETKTHLSRSATYQYHHV